MRAVVAAASTARRPDAAASCSDCGGAADRVDLARDEERSDGHGRCRRQSRRRPRPGPGQSRQRWQGEAAGFRERAICSGPGCGRFFEAERRCRHRDRDVLRSFLREDLFRIGGRVPPPPARRSGQGRRSGLRQPAARAAAVHDHRVRRLQVRCLGCRDRLALGIEQLVEKQSEVCRVERERICRDQLLERAVRVDRGREARLDRRQAFLQEGLEIVGAGISGAQLRARHVERGPPAGQKLHEDRPERVDVGVLARDPDAADFGSDVRADLGQELRGVESGKNRVRDGEAADAHRRVVRDRHEPGPEQAVRRRPAVGRGAERVFEARRDALGDEEGVLGGNADAESAHAREHGVERPARGLVPRHEGHAVDHVELRMRNDGVVHENRGELGVLVDGPRDRGLGHCVGMEHPQPHETAFVGGVERAVHGAERVLGELRDERVVAEVSRKKRGRRSHGVRRSVSAASPNRSRSEGSRRMS